MERLQASDGFFPGRHHAVRRTQRGQLLREAGDPAHLREGGIHLRGKGPCAFQVFGMLSQENRDKRVRVRGGFHFPCFPLRRGHPADGQRQHDGQQGRKDLPHDSSPPHVSRQQP